MTQQSLKDRLASFLKKHYSEAWVASGVLQRIVAAKTDYTPQNVGRRLRELENDGVLEVRYEKGHAYYRHKAVETVNAQIARSLEWFEKLPEHPSRERVDGYAHKAG